MNSSTLSKRALDEIIMLIIMSSLLHITFDQLFVRDIQVSESYNAKQTLAYRNV